MMTDPILAMAALYAGPRLKTHGTAMVFAVWQRAHAADVSLVVAGPYMALEVSMEAELPGRQRHVARFESLMMEDTSCLPVGYVCYRIRG
jgi:hypothetical protein